MASERSYTAGKFLLDIDGMRVGFLQSFEGGNMVAELASHKMGPSNFEKKHVTTTKWGAIKFKTGAGMSKGVYEWMQSAFDAGSKESAYFDIEVMPEQIRWMKESGTDVRGTIGPKQKAWHCANFRFELGGLPCGRVSKIEGLSWECKVTHDMVGEHRENTIHPTATTISDFTLTISQADLEAWAQKAKSWFVDGNCLEGDEMTGMITLLGPDMKKELATIELLNVGFKEFEANPKLEAQTESVARFKVKCYAEQVKFKLIETDA
jgi:hypothetical protein